jgi:hypothetical protein
MTTEERQRMNSLCFQIQEETNHQKFEALARELNELIVRKKRRFSQHDGISAWQRTRRWRTVSGVVPKIVESTYPGPVEKVEISIAAAEDLFREIRIENTFTDIDGQLVSLIHAPPLAAKRWQQRYRSEQRT